MTLSVLAIVMIAAVLHASWNAIVKGSTDHVTTIGLIALGHFIPAVPLVLLLPLPELTAAPYILASTVIHWFYYYYLISAYRFGDLSLAYPIVRGSAPVLIALVATVWPGEALPMIVWLGIAAVSGGILLLAFTRGPVLRGSVMIPAGVSAVTVVAYSIADGIGIRLSGAPFSYVAWLFFAEVSVAAFILLPRLKSLVSGSLRPVFIGFAGGVLSGLAYALALYAKTLAPLGVVSALRETSVVIATLIGVIWLKERPVAPRLIAAFVVTSGVIIIALASY